TGRRPCARSPGVGPRSCDYPDALGEHDVARMMSELRISHVYRPAQRSCCGAYIFPFASSGEKRTVRYSTMNRSPNRMQADSRVWGVSNVQRLPSAELSRHKRTDAGRPAGG